MSDWVATYILSCENLRQRKVILTKFIRIAQALYEMQNFNTLFSIVLGLNRQPIYRLKQTWEGISKADLAKFQSLQQIVAFGGNRKAYREVLKTAEIGVKPCVPALGVHLGDLVFFDEGNPDSKVEDGHTFINLTKRALMVETISKLMICQTVSYDFYPIECVQQFLYWQVKSNVTTSESTLHKLSKQCEP